MQDARGGNPSMNVVVASGARWRISTRRTGEVFAAGLKSEVAEILLLGAPAAYSSAEVEGWLRDLLGVARETSRQDQGERPIPLLLYHTMTGLLFSHTELWDRAADSPSSSAAFL